MLFGIYLLVLAAWFGVSRASKDSMEIVKSLVFLILLVILPLLAMVFGAWDGVKEGFSLLWLLAPFACFLAPMFPVLERQRLDLRGGLQHPRLRGPRRWRAHPRAPRAACITACKRVVLP